MWWFPFSLVAVVALAAAELVQQRLLRKPQAFSEQASASLTYLFQAVLTLPIIYFSPFAKDFFVILKPSLFLQLTVLCMLSGTATVLYLRSLNVKNISYSSIFGSVSILVSTILGSLFFTKRLLP